MKRLTEWLSDGVASWNYPDYCYSENETINKLFRSAHKRNVCERLAIIEDILCDGTDEYDLDRLAVLCNQRMTMREEVSERFGLTAKIPLDRLREIAEAERDGRCVVLPCKFGDTVYSIRHERVPDDDYRMSFHIEMRIVSQKFGLIHADCIGKSVFLTRAEAEAALKAREQDE